MSQLVVVPAAFGIARSSRTGEAAVDSAIVFAAEASCKINCPVLAVASVTAVPPRTVTNRSLRPIFSSAAAIVTVIAAAVGSQMYNEFLPSVVNVVTDAVDLSNVLFCSKTPTLRLPTAKDFLDSSLV